MGATKETLTEFPTVATTPVGAPGTVFGATGATGVTAIEAVEATELPTAFVAIM